MAEPLKTSREKTEEDKARENFMEKVRAFDRILTQIREGRSDEIKDLSFIEKEAAFRRQVDEIMGKPDLPVVEITGEATGTPELDVRNRLLQGMDAIQRSIHAGMNEGEVANLRRQYDELRKNLGNL